MWVAGVFIVYLALAILIPAVWVLAPVWRRASEARQVQCPELMSPAWIKLDARYAVRRRVFGESGVRIGYCSRWPERAGCDQHCLEQVEAPH
jgi:hypothetical protein